MCHCQFINALRDEKQLGGEQGARTGFLPRAPGYESLARVPRELARTWSWGAEVASVCGETSAAWQKDWLLSRKSFTPC